MVCDSHSFLKTGCCFCIMGGNAASTPQVSKDGNYDRDILEGLEIVLREHAGYGEGMV